MMWSDFRQVEKMIGREGWYWTCDSCVISRYTKGPKFAVQYLRDASGGGRVWVAREDTDGLY